MRCFQPHFSQPYSLRVPQKLLAIGAIRKSRRNTSWDHADLGRFCSGSDFTYGEFLLWCPDSLAQGELARFFEIQNVVNPWIKHMRIYIELALAYHVQIRIHVLERDLS